MKPSDAQKHYAYLRSKRLGEAGVKLSTMTIEAIRITYRELFGATLNSESVVYIKMANRGEL